MARKIFEKAGLIPGLPAQPKPAAEASPGTEPPKAKTAPGTMMGFLTAQSSVVQEAEVLRARVKSLEQDAPLQRLDPSKIRPSKWANRHEASFQSTEFQALKAEIAAAGGNVQPIKVRPAPVLNGSTPAAPPAYELIYGHRRHRACLELGIPVTATVEDVSDLGLFEQMERENRGRKNLSAWEQGMMYRRALDDGLYGSLRRLAESLGIDVSLVSKSVALARLPDAVIQAFKSPLDIQFRWAAALTEVMQRDPEGTLSRAKTLSASPDALPPTAILDELLGRKVPGKDKGVASELAIHKAGNLAATLSTDKKGRVLVRFEAQALPEGRYKDLVKAIEDFLKG
jgi:ParB family chromosome partitioning protein